MKVKLEKHPRLNIMTTKECELCKDQMTKYKSHIYTGVNFQDSGYIPHVLARLSDTEIRLISIGLANVAIYKVRGVYNRHKGSCINLR